MNARKREEGSTPADDAEVLGDRLEILEYAIQSLDVPPSIADELGRLAGEALELSQRLNEAGFTWPVPAQTTQPDADDRSRLAAPMVQS